MIEATIGILTYNGAPRVDHCLESIFKFTEPRKGVSLVVCDDGSTDGGKATRLVGKKYGVPVISHDRNYGISRGWNSLSRYYDCNFVVLLNDDIIVQRGWLHNLLFFLQNNKCGGVGVSQHRMHPSDAPALLRGDPVVPLDFDDPQRQRRVPTRIGQFEHCRPGRVMCATGSIFGFSRALYERIAEGFNKGVGFDEAYQSFYEESDFGTACAALGYPSYQINNPMAWHEWSATFAQNPELRASLRMQLSRAYYINKWNGHFEETNPRYLGVIPPLEVTWVAPDGKIHKEMDS